jgi:hypothetical protein
VTEKTFYYLYPDGSVTARTVVGVEEISHPDGVVLLTAEEYETRLAEIEAQREEEAAAIREAELEQKRLDYEALRLLGLPAETASRITGYYPPPEPEPEPVPENVDEPVEEPPVEGGVE